MIEFCPVRVDGDLMQEASGDHAEVYVQEVACGCLCGAGMQVGLFVICYCVSSILPIARQGNDSCRNVVVCVIADDGNTYQSLCHHRIDLALG